MMAGTCSWKTEFLQTEISHSKAEPFSQFGLVLGGFFFSVLKMCFETGDVALGQANLN